MHELAIEGWSVEIGLRASRDDTSILIKDEMMKDKTTADERPALGQEGRMA